MFYAFSKSLLGLCFLLYTCCTVTAQSTLKTGAPAPPITVTDWIANVPEDTTLSGKYIVLEFWQLGAAPASRRSPT